MKKWPNEKAKNCDSTLNVFWKILSEKIKGRKLWYAWDTREYRTGVWLGNLNKKILKPWEEVGGITLILTVERLHMC